MGNHYLHPILNIFRLWYRYILAISGLVRFHFAMKISIWDKSRPNDYNYSIVNYNDNIEITCFFYRCMYRCKYDLHHQRDRYEMLRT